RTVVSRGAARVVSDVSVLCPRPVAWPDNTSQEVSALLDAAGPPRLLACLQPAVPPPTRRRRRHAEDGRGRPQRHPTRDRRNEREAPASPSLALRCNDI